MAIIKRVVLHNYKRFKDLDLGLNDDINIFIGDNESGKSSILQAIDLTIRGSRHKVEDIGLDKLFNVEETISFMRSDRSYANLPRMFVELYLDEQNNLNLSGINNSKHMNCDGLKFVCSPNDELSSQINNVLSSSSQTFPFEFYKIEFSTFQGGTYTGHNKYMRDIFLDNSMIGSEYAMSEFVRDIFSANLSEQERHEARWTYRQQKENFKTEKLNQYSGRLNQYSFAIKNSSHNNLDTDITIEEDNITLDNKGTGRQCFIKADIALRQSGDNIDTILLEEPENHLSHINMRKLIDNIRSTNDKQIFIATHSDLISTRLNLQKCFLLNSASITCKSLSAISDDTARFFMKAPDNNMLQFVMSPKTILVEGDAEFILMDAMFQKVLGKSLDDAGVDVISVDGKCFKRYVEIAALLNLRVAVITDNDGNNQKNILDNYSGYDNTTFPNVLIKADEEDARKTFEICIYEDNRSLCDNLFSGRRRTLSVIEYMLSNKAEAAFMILENDASNIVVPRYIEEATRWIDE